MPEDGDVVAIGFPTPKELKTWANDLKHIYPTPYDTNFDDLLRRLKHATEPPPGTKGWR
jgi:hypothetical protein